jgi:hypothetical protein
VREVLLAAALLAAAGGEARGERPLDLRLRALPVATPETLAMRPRRPAPIQVPAELRTAAAEQPAAPRPSARQNETTTAAVLRTSEGELGDPIKRLEEKVIFRFSLGFGIDGGQQSEEPPLVGGTLERGVNYAPLRSYGFGDVVLGSRGLLMNSLGTYFASEFRADYSGRLETPFTGAVPSVYYADDDTNKVLFRQGYAEIDGFFERKWLKPIYFRAGRQFKYGVGVVHFDGTTLGYDTKVFALHIWSGQRVSLYGLDDLESPPLVVGSGARLDLFEWKRIPVVLTTDTLDLEGVNHREFGLAFRWSEDVMIRASARRLGGNFARQTLRVWTRLSEVTTVNVDLDNRTEDDWMYDLWMLRPVDQPGDPRSYLNLGTPLPRLQLAARAGTVILRNLDVLLRVAGAVEHAGEDQDSEFSPSYLEAGGAIEVRLRRNIRVGSTFVARRYGRDARDPIPELPEPQPIPDPGDEIGDLSFYEGGLGIDYSVGARRFNASAELYGRAYDRASPYEEVVTDGFDTHSGGRFSVEGWARSQLRIKAEYDVSLGPLDVAPELRGVKMLRVLTEGTF